MLNPNSTNPAEERPNAKAIKYISLIELDLDSVLITSLLKHHDQLKMKLKKAT